MQQVNKKTFELKFPIPRTHCGMVMGNGNFGALIWGTDRLHITVNRADFWDHRGGECLMPDTPKYDELKYIYNKDDGDSLTDAFTRIEKKRVTLLPSRIPVGRFEFKLKENVKLETCRLNYDTGAIAIIARKADKCCELRLIMGIKTNILLVEDPDCVIDAPLQVPAWKCIENELRKFDFEAPEMIDHDGIRGWVQSCPEDPSLAILAKKIKQGYLISLELGDDNDKARAASIEQINEIQCDEVEKFISDTRDWWNEYWSDIPQIRLPDEFLNEFHDYALYKFACATNPHSPIPSGLQGPWIEEYQMARWCGDYHFNVNIQQIYTLAFATGKFDHALPLFDMLESESFQNVMRNNAKHLFGIDDGLLLTHAVDDHGYQCGGISSGSVLDFAVGGWTAQLYWFYYIHTLDTTFLRDRAWPFMRGIMRVFEESLEEHEGRLSIPLSISAEYSATLPNGTFQRAGRDPSYQLSVLHMLTDALTTSASILGEPVKPIWKTIKEKLPPYTLIDDDGAARIAVWEDQDLDQCHRHHSHLACVYPFATIDADAPENKTLIDNSVDHWIAKGIGQWSEWCMPWATIIHARLGFKESPRMLLETWRELFVNEGMATVYLPRFRGITAHRRDDMRKPKETSEIMQLDGTMAGVSAIYEMMIHTKNGITHIFPAISDKWKNCSFENIHVPGGFIMSAEMKNGQTSFVKIKSSKGGTIEVMVNDEKHTIELIPEEEKIIS